MMKRRKSCSSRKIPAIGRAADHRLIFAFAVCLSLGAAPTGPASADMFLHLTDGRLVVLPVDREDVESITYGERSSEGPATNGDGVTEETSRFSRLPSPAGAHIARLKQLEPGTWLNLGSPAPDPVWGKARGRSWTTNMAFAPSLEGALLYGEGTHGWYNRANGRYMDDLWLYDVMAHRWINVHPGTDVRNPPQLTVNSDGFVAFENGSPIPIGTMVHGYQMTTWDSHRKWHLSMPNPGTYFRKTLPSVADFLDRNRDRLNSRRASPWIYDTTRDRWRRHATKGRSPPSGYGDTLIYIPSLRKSFFYHKRDVWFYDADRNDWQRANPLGPRPPFGIDATACHDPLRNRIYIGGGSYPVAKGPNAFWIYDLEANRWIDPKPRGSPGGNSYATDYAMMHCDLANDVVLIVRHKGDNRGVFAYSPGRNEWQSVSRTLPREWTAGWWTGGSSGFYHPRLNVHLFHVAADSRDNGVILAYRYQ